LQAERLGGQIERAQQEDEQHAEAEVEQNIEHAGELGLAEPRRDEFAHQLEPRVAQHHEPGHHHQRDAEMKGEPPLARQRQAHGLGGEPRGGAQPFGRGAGETAVERGVLPQIGEGEAGAYCPFVRANGGAVTGFRMVAQERNLADHHAGFAADDQHRPFAAGVAMDRQPALDQPEQIGGGLAFADDGFVFGESAERRSGRERLRCSRRKLVPALQQGGKVRSQGGDVALRHFARLPKTGCGHRAIML
jgi:hypothetical protein